MDRCEQVDLGLKLEEKKLKFDHVFDIKTPTRTYYLAADTENEMKSWVTCISRVCDLKCTSGEEDCEWCFFLFGYFVCINAWWCIEFIVFKWIFAFSLERIIVFVFLLTDWNSNWLYLWFFIFYISIFFIIVITYFYCKCSGFIICCQLSFYQKYISNEFTAKRGH